MRRIPLRLTQYFLLAFILCATAQAHAACAPSPASDGGSVCLPEGWRTKSWENTADLGQELTPGARLCDQVVFIASLQDGPNSPISVVISRMGVAHPSGELLPVSPYASRDLIERAAAMTPKEQIVSPPQEVTVGGRKLWRCVTAEPDKSTLYATYRIFTNNASYEILLVLPLQAMPRLPSLEQTLINGWKPGDAPMRMPLPSLNLSWRHFDSPQLPGVQLALPEGWQSDLTSPMKNESLGDGQTLHITSIVEARGELPGGGRAMLEVHSLWVTGAAGQSLRMYETDSLKYGDAILANLSRSNGMTRTGTGREEAGRMTLRMRFYSLASTEDQRPLAATAAVIAGARRTVVCILYHDKDQASFWCDFLTEMLRNWEMSPNGADNLMPLVRG